MDTFSLVNKLHISFKNSLEMSGGGEVKPKIVPSKMVQNETVDEAFDEANNRDMESKVSGGVSLDNLLTDILKGGGKMKGGNVEKTETVDAPTVVAEVVKEEPKQEVKEEPKEEAEKSEVSDSSDDDSEFSDSSSSSSSEDDDKTNYETYMKQLKGGKISTMKPFKGGSYVPQHKSMIIGGFPYVLKSKTKN